MGQSLKPKNGGKMMLPGPDVQPVILDRRRRGDRVAPRTPEPFDRMAIERIAGDPLQVVEHLMESHLTHAVEQRARILEHDARFFAFMDELRNELPHAFVAPDEYGRVMVIADALVIHHILEIADDLGAANLVTTGGNQWLMHMQRHSGGALDALEVEPTLRKVPRPHGSVHQSTLNQLFPPGDVGQTIDIFLKFSHTPYLPAGLISSLVPDVIVDVDVILARSAP